MTSLNFSRVYIPTLLYEGPRHGYSIISRFKKRIGKAISPSLVYPFLQQLEQKGLVGHTMKPVAEKEKKIYELTEEGKKLFKRFAALVSVAIEPSLEICANCGCKVYEGGYKETIDGRETVFCCEHCANSYKQEKNHVHEAKSERFNYNSVINLGIEITRSRNLQVR